MGIADIVALIAYADTDALPIADKWLAEMEIRDRGAKLLSTFDTRKARHMRRALVQGVK